MAAVWVTALRAEDASETWASCKGRFFGARMPTQLGLSSLAMSSLYGGPGEAGSRTASS